MTDPNASPDPTASLNQGPIPLPVMGMTATEYQTAFAYLDHMNFAREVEEHKARSRRRMAKFIKPVPFYERYEFWALILGLLSLMHGVFVTWVKPMFAEEGNKDEIKEEVETGGQLDEIEHAVLSTISRLV
ncbi:hypothetical protein F4808DRAFT_466060 [Astrocystis sublimbata]|nr:hypothetical protein F4808DRAFT_466060 [Astrocystis sublimbata]